MSSVATRRAADEVRKIRAHEPLYRTVIGVAKVTFKAMDWTVPVEGAEHVPAQGPAIIASNHLSYLDFIFLGWAAREQRRLVRFMAIRSAFDHPVSGPLLRGMRHIPVDREHDPARAFDAATDVLLRGEVVGLHPEGRIRRDSHEPRPWKTGAVRLALETGAPLIPAAVWGTQQFLQPGARRRFPRHVSVPVRMGPALRIEPGASLQDATEHLRERIVELEQRSSASALR